MNKHLFLWIPIIVFHINLKASPQLPDYIIIEKDTLRTYNLIVENYLQNLNPDEEKLFGLSFRNSLERIGTSFNCWRGYQAIYKIENDSLFVSSIIDCHSLKNLDIIKSQQNLKLLFGNKLKNNKVYVDWFSGDLNFPGKKSDNEILRWDGVFEYTYLYETLLKIKNGKVVFKKNIQNYIDLANGINRKIDDNVSDILFEHIKNYNWKKIDKFDCSEEFEIGVNKKGKIKHIKILNYTEDEIKSGDFFEKGQYKHCSKSVKSALKKIRFDIIKHKGKPIEENYRIELWFNDNGSIENWSN